MKKHCFGVTLFFTLPLLAVLMCVVPLDTLAQVAGGSITGTARGDSGTHSWQKCREAFELRRLFWCRS